MKRPGPLKRRRRPKPKQHEWPFLPETWKAHVSRQPVLLSRLEPSLGPVTTQAHHVIPQQTLRAQATVYGKPAWMLLWDERVGVHVSKRRHERHHSGHEPILRRELPDAVFQFAAEWGLTWYLDRHYPKETP